MTKLGRAKFVTYCGTCEQMVGAMTTPFNKNPGDYMPKTSSHHNREGRKCGGSRLTVHPSAVMAAS